MVRRRPLWKVDIRKLSARSSRCCPKASTLYPLARAAAYNRPRFMRLQKEQTDEQPFSRLAACSKIAAGKRIARFEGMALPTPW